MIANIFILIRFKLSQSGHSHLNAASCIIYLVRNALGSWKTMLDSKNHEIQWNLIVKLYDYQRRLGFTFANKLSKQHIEFEKNKMKVKYAVQVLSQSVANALLAMSELKHPDFVNVQATVDYLKKFDRIYDIMNSRNLAQSFDKAPLQKHNEQSWKCVFNETVDYICNLKTKTGQSVLESSRYAAFLGWLVNIKTITELYEYVVTSGEMTFMCTFRLSQDPLEKFFSSIRMSCGFNNNPTTIQFRAAFESLLCNSLNRKNNGNCIFDDTITIPSLTELCYDFDVPKAILDLKGMSHDIFCCCTFEA